MVTLLSQVTRFAVVTETAWTPGGTYDVGHADAECRAASREVVGRDVDRASSEAWPCSTCIQVDRKAKAPPAPPPPPAERARPQDAPLDHATAEAIAYAKNYTGSFSFMLSMRTKAGRPGWKPSPSMVAAILRCKASDVAQGPTPRRPSPEVPEGRYAVVNHEGRTVFLRVDRPTEGKWAGYTFVKVQAGDEYHPARGSLGDALLALIAEDIDGARVRYGVESVRCYRCGRSLTDPESRQRGVGPECVKRG